MPDHLGSSGVKVADDTFEDMNGRFGHRRDLEGNLVQFWEPHPGI